MEETKKEVMEQEAVQEEPYKSGSVHYIDSRDVAEMVGKGHDKLMRDIRRYSEHLGEAKIGESSFWIKSTYINSQNKEQPCYLVTEKGCEFIAHKLTGQKGSEFTARYIDRFHEMKGELEGQADMVLQEFMKQQAICNQQQADVINAVVNLAGQMMEGLKDLSAEVESLRSQRFGISSGNPFSVQQDVVDQRMRTLNGLIDQVSDLCQMERNKVLHFLYKTLQESLGVTLNPYLMVMKSERGEESICNLHVIASVDRFYERAAEMCQDVIDRKNLFD